MGLLPFLLCALARISQHPAVLARWGGIPHVFLSFPSQPCLPSFSSELCSNMFCSAWYASRAKETPARCAVCGVRRAACSVYYVYVYGPFGH